jgi:hypothetical protein
MVADDDLAAVADAFNTLPKAMKPAMRAGIVAMILAVTGNAAG